MRRVLIFALLATTLSACSSEPPTYRVLVTEPSHNMRSDGQLFAHWSCDPRVEPETRYQGAQDALWTSVNGEKGRGLLEVQATCAPGSLLTVQTDAGIPEVGGVKTILRCEVFDADGQRVADETVARTGRSDAICRVAVPS